MHNILWFQGYIIFIAQWRGPKSREKAGGIWIHATLYQCRTGEIVSAAAFAAIDQDDYHDDNDDDYDKVVDVGDDEVDVDVYNNDVSNRWTFPWKHSIK